MNRYDKLPTLTKAVFFAAGLAPCLYVGWLRQSILLGLAVFAVSFVLALIFRSIAGNICAQANKLPTGEVDEAAVHECFIWPFLLAGPASALAVAWAALKYLSAGD